MNLRILSYSTVHVQSLARSISKVAAMKFASCLVFCFRVMLLVLLLFNSSYHALTYVVSNYIGSVAVQQFVSCLSSVVSNVVGSIVVQQVKLQSVWSILVA